MALDELKGGPSKTDMVQDRDYLNRRLSEMETEYQTFEDHYKDLSEYIDPRRGRFFVQDRNKGDKRHKNIINNKATKALRTATSGMFAGMMSPSRPWFVLESMDHDLMKSEAVRVWLELLRDIALKVFARSNFYNMAPLMLRELLLFGVGCMTHVDDFDDVARFYTHTVGSYYIAQNDKYIVDTIARRFQMQCIQLIRKFGLENVSTGVRNNYDNGNYGTWHTVVHFIEPNPFRDDKEISSEFKPYRSVYFEQSRNAEKQIFLSRKGFDGFPAYVPRWELADGDIYAVNCPGMTNLGDVRQLQQQEREKAKAIAKAATPPLQGPPSFRNQPIPNLPGGVAINSAMGTNAKLEPIYQPDPRVQELLFDIQKTEKRIEEGFFTNLFMAITDMEGIQPKNELQLSQINQERLLQIGPALEQVHGEWLERLVLRTLSQILKADIMPPAPPELQGKELELNFISSLAQAQKSTILGGIERTFSFAGSLMESGFTGVADKLDADSAIEEYGRLSGMPSRHFKPDDVVMKTREERQQQQQQLMAMEQAQQAANVAKMTSDAKLDDDNVLSRTTGANS